MKVRVDCVCLVVLYFRLLQCGISMKKTALYCLMVFFVISLDVSVVSAQDSFSANYLRLRVGRTFLRSGLQACFPEEHARSSTTAL